jgi:cell division protein FtsB
MVLLLGFNIFRSWYELNLRGDIIKQTEDRLAEAKRQNASLQKELARVESNDFIEKEARNKLNLGREGETVVLLPPITPEFTPTPVVIENLQNWQKWMRLFIR